ncbi:MAG: hypothetical protein IPL78_36190 [Chloroflexi bacterium]|nr:hypothetical protein [Chloroflexota bacterium]
MATVFPWRNRLALAGGRSDVNVRGRGPRPGRTLHIANIGELMLSLGNVYTARKFLT